MSEEVTEREREILRHALGLSRSKQMYRNHFAADGEGDDYNDCRTLEKKGLMKESYSSDTLVFFCVTEAGKALFQKLSPAPAPGLTKYKFFYAGVVRGIRHADAHLEPDEQGEWVKIAEVEMLLDDPHRLAAVLVARAQGRRG